MLHKMIYNVAGQWLCVIM